VVDETRLLQAAAAGARSAERRDRLVTAGLQITLLVVFLLSWNWASGRIVHPLFVSTPPRVAAALWRLVINGEIWYHVRFTLMEALAGYAIGASAALAAATGVSLVPHARQILHPFLVALYAVPKIAIAPLIIMWFGLGILPKVLLAALFVFFVVFLNTVTGIQGVSGQLVGVAAVMGARPWRRMVSIVLPSAIPYILVALRVTIPAAMIGAVVGEFISSNRGLGYLINAASSRYDTAAVFAGIFSLLLVVIAMNSAVGWLERRLLRWRP
jgi:NitT/TauT family transport system permease protein